MINRQTAGTIISVGGGKGGVGKSILSIALGTVLARGGSSVVLADLDLGAANLHTYLGIRGHTPGIADFILGKVPSLESILVETSVPNLGLISGAEFVPGATNPAHWMKLKLMRHLRSLPADYVIIDLGAGVQFNTLDFFGMSDHGIVITAPEPGAVMNAYSFIKGALYRKIQNIFKHHAEIAALIEAETRIGGSEKRFTLEWLSERLKSTSPDLLPLIDEIARSFTPALVINRAPEGQTHLLVKNLITLCSEKIGITLDHVGDLPDVREISNHLLNVPRFFDLSIGESYHAAAQGIVNRLIKGAAKDGGRKARIFDFSDEERDEIILLLDSLDERVFSKTSKKAWKLRMFFKPSEVVGYLISRGITHPLFYTSA
ncbi:MAG: MinD/ParA family protein [Nitrospirae bacterium]|nr:MinD/ParA family protein [Nitrospirota bacterium]NTW65656.1 MinD/ParA family protein [Nitrospirota bacterium]